MAPKIKISGESLQTLGTNLQGIVDTLNVAHVYQDWGALTGEELLAGALSGFDDKWEIKRGKMVENITKLQEMITAVIDTLDEVDGCLTGSLTGEESEGGG